MFFPKLKRRAEHEYHNTLGGFYADYRKNYKKVSEDCQHRCVYCDITVEESGGDEMHLDHFRPQEHFEELSTHPYNLYLACPKCNILKTSDWPSSKRPQGPTFVGRIGYLDRFNHDCNIFLRVEKDGRIIATSGPTEYMIKKMHLNRPSRINVRRKRFIEQRKTQLLKGILRLTENLNKYESEGKLSKNQALEKRKIIESLLINYAKL